MYPEKLKVDYNFGKPNLLEILEWLYSTSALRLIAEAMGLKDVLFMQWIGLQKMVDKRWTVRPPFINLQLCGQGYFEVVKWLHKNICFATNCEGNGPEGDVRTAMKLAFGNNHFDIVIWLYQNRIKNKNY
jgi:hypothetical protein